MSVRRGWNAQFLGYELGAGLAVAAGIVLWSEVFGGSEPVEHFIDAHSGLLYTVAAPIDAALLGFILAAAAIIVTAAPDDRMAILRESKHYSDLWACFRSAMRFLAAATVVTLAGLVVAGEPGARIMFFIVAALSVLSALRVGRCVWALNWIIRIFTGPPLERSPLAPQTEAGSR